MSMVSSLAKNNDPPFYLFSIGLFSRILIILFYQQMNLIVCRKKKKRKGSKVDFLKIECKEKGP